MLKLIPFLLLSVGGQVVPCGSALCVGGNQQAVTLGGTVQANQGYWPDGGLAELVPVVPGASLALIGTQQDPYDGGPALAPDVILGSRNSAIATRTLVSVRANQSEVFAIKGNGALAAGVITASSAMTASSFPCDGGTPASTYTVNSGVHCVCGGLGAACTVSSTTLTTHCASSDVTSVGFICL
jgi:hypothetical protein